MVRSEQAGWCDLIAVELWNGAQGEKEKKALQDLELAATHFSIETTVWKRARKLARHCRVKGVTVPAIDLVIAACASHYGLEIEHCDHHFEIVLPIASRL